MTKATMLEGLAARAANEGLVDAVYEEVSTPIGRLIVVQSRRGLCRVGFAEEREDAVLFEVAQGLGPRVLRSGDATREVREAIDAYFAGEIGALKVPVDLSLVRSDFRRRVLQKLRRVPPGRVVTYGDLAASAGYARAARAVGTACATNPVPLVVPCHRVVPASGGVGNYGGGAHRKEWLLHFEGVAP